MLNGRNSGFVSPLIDGFGSHSCQVLCFEPHDYWDFKNCDYLLMYGPMQSMERVITQLRGVSRVPPIVFWLTEQLPKPSLNLRMAKLLARGRFAYENYTNELSKWSGWGGSLQRLTDRAGRFRIVGELLELHRFSSLKLELVCTFSETNREFLSRLGLPVVHIPMGYHKSLGADLKLARDVDVVFLGSTRDSRRRELVTVLEKTMTSRKIRFVIKDGSKERGSVHGEDRMNLLNRSKIMLNIMRQPWDDLVYRELLAAPNRAMVVSESLIPTALGPFYPNAHFAMAELDQLVDTITHFLKHDEERHIITNSAYDFVTKEMTMENMVGLLLDELGLPRQQ